MIFERKEHSVAGIHASLRTRIPRSFPMRLYIYDLFAWLRRAVEDKKRTEYLALSLLHITAAASTFSQLCEKIYARYQCLCIKHQPPARQRDSILSTVDNDETRILGRIYSVHLLRKHNATHKADRKISRNHVLRFDTSRSH